MSTMSPPASAMAWAILATMPRLFLPVVVMTARGPRLLASSAHDAHNSARASVSAARGVCPVDLPVDLPAAVSAATSRMTSSMTPLRRESALSRATVDLHAIDDRDDGGVDGDVGLAPRGQLLAHRHARGVAERDQHVVAGPGVQRVGADDQVVGRLRALGPRPRGARRHV